jgi:hypothetical protein
MYFGVSKFAQAEPLYSFHRQNLLARVHNLLQRGARLRFVGHACEIGSAQINLDLSKKRAKLYHERFRQDVKEDYPDLYENIKGRLDPP